MTATVPTEVSHSSPILPFELFQLIIDEITTNLGEHSDHASPVRKDVIALSLVCHAFNQICRPHLFRLVKIDFNASETQQRSTENLASILMDLSPEQQLEITSYIQEVHYVGPAHESRLTHIPESFNTFLRFPSVKVLRIGMLRTHSYHYGSINSFGYRAILNSCIATGQLTSLFIGRVKRLPILQILSCPNLHTLHIKGCTLDIPDDGSGLPFGHAQGKPFALQNFTGRGGRMDKNTFVVIASCPRLKNLEFSYDARSFDEFTTELRDPILFPELESLSYNVADDWSYTCDRAKAAGVKAFPRLKKVVFSADTESESTSRNVVFQHLCVVQEVHVQGSRVSDFVLLNLSDCMTSCRETLESVAIKWTTDIYTECLDIVTALCSSLEKMGHTGNALQHLDLQLNIGALRTVNTDNPFNFEPWRRLDRILAGDGRSFPSLRTVRLALLPVTYDVENVHSERLYEAFNDSLGRLRLAQRVELQTRVDKP